MVAFGRQLGAPLTDANQAVTYMVKMPEYRRFLVDSEAALNRHVDALGDQHPAIVEARAALERARIKFNQVASAIADAWRRAQQAGQVGDPEVVGDGLGGDIASAFRMTAAVALIVVAFLAWPAATFVAVCSALAGLLAALAEWVDRSAEKARVAGYPIVDPGGKVLAPSPTQQTTEMIGAVSGGLGKVALLGLLAIGAYFALGRRRR